jgi:hypothetical protein
MRDGRQVGLRRAAVLLVLLPSVTPLQTRVLRPPGRAPFPLAMVSHGSPPDWPPPGALWQRPVEMFLDSRQH